MNNLKAALISAGVKPKHSAGGSRSRNPKGKGRLYFLVSRKAQELIGPFQHEGAAKEYIRDNGLGDHFKVTSCRRYRRTGAGVRV